MSKIGNIFASAHEAIVSKNYDKDVSIVAAVESNTNAGLTAFGTALSLAAALDGATAEAAPSKAIEAATKAAAAVTADRGSLFQPVGDKHAQMFGANLNVADVASLEHFDGRAVDVYQAATFAYNVEAATQDDFSEAFFPTVIGDISTAGISVTLRTTQVINSFLRNTPASDAKKFNRQSLITAISDPGGILASDQLKLLPVVGGAFDAQLNVPLATAKFYDASGDTVQSAPYVIGSRLNILGASQSTALLAKGVMDNTDTLDTNLPLEALYFATTTATKFVRVDVSKLAGAVFIAGQRGDSKDLVLSTKTTIVVDLSTLVDHVTGTTIAGLAALPAGSKAVFDVELMGNGNATDGELSVYVGAWTFVGARDLNGNVIAPASVAYTAIQTQAVAMTAVGVDIDARITNSNIRRNGINLTSKPTTEKLPVRAKTPITTDSPVIGQNVGPNDGAFLTDLVSVTGILANFSAVKTLLGFAAFMKGQAGVNPAEINTNTLGQTFCKPFYKFTAMNLSQYVDSTRGQDRSEDIKATVVNNIATDVANMLSLSGYSNYEKFVKRAGKTDIIIGTYPALAAYLGDSIDLGNNCVAKVVTTDNTDINGKLFITVGDRNADQSAVAIDRFGSRLYVPSLVSKTNVTENGATVNKTVVNPVFDHVVTLPVLVEYAVTGLDLVLAKVAQNRRTVL